MAVSPCMVRRTRPDVELSGIPQDIYACCQSAAPCPGLILLVQGYPLDTSGRSEDQQRSAQPCRRFCRSVAWSGVVLLPLLAPPSMFGHVPQDAAGEALRSGGAPHATQHQRAVHACHRTL